MPLKSMVRIRNSLPLQAIAEAIEKSYSPSQSPETDERNREHLIDRAALGDNPTKKHIDEVMDYGLEKHRINFPDLCGLNSD